MKVCFITGLSKWGNNTLSPIQTEFLNKLDTTRRNKIFLNFPYINQNLTYKEPHIICASISNAYQYLLSKTYWIEDKSEHLKSIIKEERKVLLLSGSCGLELIRNMKFTKDEKERLHVMAYGAVAKKIPDLKYLTLVQSKNDWISRMWIKDYDFMIEGNHMNYLESEKFLKITNEYIKKMEKK